MRQQRAEKRTVFGQLTGIAAGEEAEVADAVDTSADDELSMTTRLTH